MKGSRGYGIKATALWLGFVGIMILGGMNLQICRALGGFLHILSAGVIAVMICATVILILSLPVLTSARDQNLSLKDTLMQAVRTVILHPLQSFPALLLTVLPLAVIYLDEVNRPTYGFIGTFFGFALLAYIIGKILYPVLAVPSEDRSLGGENEKSRGQNPFARMLSERRAKNICCEEYQPISEALFMKDKTLLTDKLALTIRCQRGRTIEMAVSPYAGWIETDNIRMQVQTEKRECSLLGTLELSIHTNTLEESCLLEKDRPIRIALPLTEIPEKITALYMFNPWWTRPAFPASCAEIPDKTQVALLKFTDRIVCLVPMVGDRMKTMLCPGNDEQSVCMEMTAYVGGISSLREPIFLWSEGETVSDAVHAAFARLSEIKEIPLRENRRIPEMFRYLGWCSWDAFRTDISAEGVRAKAAELAEKQVPVRWMLIDDGWMTSTDKTLADYVPDPVKFPGGFGPLTKELRDQGMIRWFGVWHALGGYWDGVDPESCLASEKRDALRDTSSGRLVPDPDKGASFYHDWYRELRKEGIDFVKVDGQSICPFYYEDNVPLAKAARGIHQQLESGVSRMDGNIINCMGMAMENVLARPSSAVSRNSDDFLPAQEDSFVEHLMQNAYNALYHNEIYCCDWDMFWTKHVHAKKHALLRAISGGPVYFSDKTGNTDPELLKCLALSDGKLLMMDRSAMPTEDCVFTDPRKEGVLKLHNTGTREDGTRGGGIAVLNLTGQAQSFRFSAKEIPELTEGKYWMFDFMKATATLVERTDEIKASLGAGEFAWYVFLPAGKNMSCLGLLDKYAGFMAAEHTAARDDCDILVLAESGQIGWASKKNIRRVMADGTDVTSQVSKNGELFKISLPPGKGKVVLTIEWNN